MSGEKDDRIVVRYDRGILNERPYRHNCRHGSVFRAERCDFKGGVEVAFCNGKLTDKQRMEDVAEMIGFHAVNVYPYLNGFSGYDCIEFKNM